MKRTFAILLVSLFVPLWGAVGADKPLTVVELFTSQGCSSCPPADALIGELTADANVLPLSLHVDYWDYIGWSDRFARPGNTERQRGYSRRFNLRYVYTPQIVVDGAFEASGGKRADIYNYIERAKTLPHVALKLTRRDNGLQLELPASSVDGEVDIISVFADRRHDTKIMKGENRGRTLSYHNVVRHMEKLGTWHGKARTMAVGMADTGGDFCAVILQMAKSRRIIGVAQVALDGS